MINFEDLTQIQKMLFARIENQFLDHNSISGGDFVTVLGVLINKYKIK